MGHGGELRNANGPAVELVTDLDVEALPDGGAVHAGSEAVLAVAAEGLRMAQGGLSWHEDFPESTTNRAQE